jgi:hypothetical protein
VGTRHGNNAGLQVRDRHKKNSNEGGGDDDTTTAAAGTKKA